MGDTVFANNLKSFWRSLGEKISVGCTLILQSVPSVISLHMGFTQAINISRGIHLKQEAKQQRPLLTTLDVHPVFTAPTIAESFSYIFFLT